MSPSEAARAKALSKLCLSVEEKIALDDAGWAAWSKAWDEVRDRDAREGRRYDRTRQGEAASAARIAVYEAALAKAECDWCGEAHGSKTVDCIHCGADVEVCGEDTGKETLCAECDEAERKAAENVHEDNARTLARWRRAGPMRVAVLR